MPVREQDEQLTGVVAEDVHHAEAAELPEEDLASRARRRGRDMVHHARGGVGDMDTRAAEQEMAALGGMKTPVGFFGRAEGREGARGVGRRSERAVRERRYVLGFRSVCNRRLSPRAR